MNNMQKLSFLVFLISLQASLNAQPEVDTLSRLLLALDDTITIFQNDRRLIKSSVSEVEKGTGEIQIDLNKNKGDWAQIYRVCTRGDTLLLNPNVETAIFVPTTNGFDTILVLLNFFESDPSFSAEYQNLNKGLVQFSIPPVYELVHIAFSITRQGMLEKETFDSDSYYYEEVNRHFMQYKDHPLINSLNRKIAGTTFDQVFKDYTEFSLPLTFQGRSIVHNDIYPMPYRINPWSGEALQQLQDFADQSDFLDFLGKHAGYHQKLLHEQDQFLRLDSLWIWLEEQFPERVDGYQIVFSPLCTERSDGRLFVSDDYQECVILLDNPEKLIQESGSNAFKEARLLKKAFDELMPIYQKILIEKNKAAIQEVFGDRSSWLANGVYARPEEVFQAYMDNAIFCLWAEDNLTSLNARIIRQEIEKEMLNKGFIRFYVFSRALTSLFREYTGQKKVADLYQELLQQY